MAADEHWIYNTSFELWSRTIVDKNTFCEPCNELFHLALELELQQLLEQDLPSK